MNDEKKAIEVLKHCKDRNFSAFDKIYFDDGTNMCIFQAIETLLTSYEKQKNKIKKIKQIVDIYNNTSGEFATLPNEEEICLSDNAPVLEYLQELVKEEN